MQKIITILTLSMLFLLHTLSTLGQTFVGYSADSLVITHLEFDVNNPKTVTVNELFYGILGLNADNKFEAFDESAITADLYNIENIIYNISKTKSYEK